MSAQATQNIPEGSTVITIDENVPTSSETEVIELGDRTRERPRVQWTTNTVDNENMGKKSSKCCCIYKRKKKWNEDSDSDSDCETGHCRGHVEKKHQHKPDDGGPGPSGTPA
uniref:Protein phosphatase 1 regulatory subunit 11 n=1 Tax=Panagrolaimus sp. JU765 TaxID=591449 RepID=A0AC34QQZ6_9BILA